MTEHAPMRLPERAVQRATQAIAVTAAVFLAATWAAEGSSSASRSDDQLGSGTATLFVGMRSTGSENEHQSAWLDRTGEVLAIDDFETAALAICPGERLAVQVTTDGGADGQEILVRDLTTLDVVERYPAPRGVAAEVVTCRSEDAADVLIGGVTGVFEARTGTSRVLVTCEGESGGSSPSPRDGAPDPGGEPVVIVRECFRGDPPLLEEDPLLLSRRFAVAQSFHPEHDRYFFDVIELDTRGASLLLPSAPGFAVEVVAVDPAGARLAILDLSGRRPRIIVQRIDATDVQGTAPQLVDLARRTMPGSFQYGPSKRVITDAPLQFGWPLHIAWLDADRIAYVRTERPNPDHPRRGVVTVLDAADLSVLCEWRGWNVEPLESEDGLLLGPGGPFREVPTKQRADPFVTMTRFRETRNGRAVRTWGAASRVAVRDASGAPSLTLVLPDAEPSGLIVPLPGFDAGSLVGERPAGCEATDLADTLTLGRGEASPPASSQAPRAPARVRVRCEGDPTWEDLSEWGKTRRRQGLGCFRLELSWRDRASSESGYRIYARSFYFDCRRPRSLRDRSVIKPSRVLLAELPEDTGSWAIEVPGFGKEMDTFWPKRGVNPNGLRFLVASFNDAGESRRVAAQPIVAGSDTSCL